MTLPYERTRAVVQTEQFLKDLMDTKKTPKVPKEIRKQAGSLLRHYPNSIDMEIISKREDKNDATIICKVFGTDTFSNKLICPKCGVNRIEVDCPSADRIDCGIKVNAQ